MRSQPGSAPRGDAGSLSRCAVLSLIGLAFLSSGLVEAHADELPSPSQDVRSAPSRHEGMGIWKAVVPPGRMNGEFESRDPIGLASGAKIKADCSINWNDPDTGKLYCFSSATSLSYFLDRPRHNIARAQKEWLRLAEPTR